MRDTTNQIVQAARAQAADVVGEAAVARPPQEELGEVVAAIRGEPALRETLERMAEMRQRAQALFERIRPIGGIKQIGMRTDEDRIQDRIRDSRHARAEMLQEARRQLQGNQRPIMEEEQQGNPPKRAREPAPLRENVGQPRPKQQRR
jgi:hypothetical protein